MQKTFLPAVPIDQIVPWDKNPRDISPQALARLKNKLKDLGQFKPLLCVPGSGHLYCVICGNQRLKAAREMGIKALDVLLFPRLKDKAQILKIVLADNQSDGFTVSSQLTECLSEAGLEPAALMDYCVITENGSSLSIEEAVLPISCLPQEDLEKYDEAPNLSKEPAKTQPGDIFILGRHRLICGDCTNAETWARLMGDEVGDLLLTDPPYNVDYEGTNGQKIANDKMSASDFAAFLGNAFGTVSAFLRPGAAFYIWYADKEAVAFRQACQVAGLSVRQGLVWVKNHFVLGRQDYQWRHEPCLYGWKEGACHYFAKDRTQSTVLEYPKPQRADQHPTMKPVALMAQLVENSTRNGGIVADGFGGSGSTLVACELCGRSCRIIELDPRYCDVIVKRYRSLKGSDENIFVIRDGVKQPAAEALGGL